MFKMPWTKIRDLAAQVVEWQEAHQAEAQMHSHTLKVNGELQEDLKNMTLTAEALKAQLDQSRQERDSALDANKVLSALAKHRLEKIESAQTILSEAIHDPFIKSSKALKSALAQSHEVINKAKDALCQAQEQS